MADTSSPDTAAVRAWLRDLQDRLTAALETADGQGRFREDAWERPGGGGGRSRVLTGGALFEQAGINFSHVRGERLPATATAGRPELAGRDFEAMGVSLVLHPENPYCPSSHLNVRFFLSPGADGAAGGPPVWWFGGGFDLTPYYGFDEDCVHWHRVASDACRPFGEAVYPRYKAWCDQYFHLRHRNEPRGIGGIFFDDLGPGGLPGGGGDFATCYAFTRAVAEVYLQAYLPIAERRRAIRYGERERAFQKYRRGRYVEFNLVCDRGTLFGLQSGGRTESILMSLPPEVSWRYDWHPEPGTPEARLYDRYLVPRDWLAGAPAGP